MAMNCGGNFTPNLNLKLLESHCDGAASFSIRPSRRRRQISLWALLDWESDVSRYEAEFAKTIDEEDKRAVLLEVAPTALKQHLAQNSASLVSYVMLRQTIVGYLQAKNVWTSGRGEGNLYGAAASVPKKPAKDPNAMQIDAFNSKGKSKGDAKGKDKGDWNKGQTQWQEQRKGKGDDKGKGKGKDDAERQARRRPQGAVWYLLEPRTRLGLHA
ncbi:unnamed protein product [Polarella glacialis]|uniref:Uncharacterized protein n=1 Tax=Polarella glacialis TaxID=89957 RepID=A0A813JLN2_POLGL|nr:unnamed protein product [Polarella glacialis]